MNHHRHGLLLLILAAFALWLATLTQRSIWADELATVVALQQPNVPALLDYIPESERRPPLYFVLLWLWTRATGANEFALRYFSLCFATLSVPTLFALVRAVERYTQTTRSNAWLAALFIALSPTLALYGVMVRYYALVLFLALLLSLIFVSWLRASQTLTTTPNGASLTLFSTMIIASMVQQYEHLTRLRVQRQQFFCMISWLIGALLLIYSDYSALALLGAQTIWLWTQRHSLRGIARRWAMLLVILALAFIPLLINLLKQTSGEVLAADLGREPLGVALKILYPFFSFTFGETIFPWYPIVLIAAPVITLTLIAALRAQQTRWLLLYALLHLGLSIVFNALILSTVATDLAFLTIASRTLFALPFFLIILVIGIGVLPMRWRITSIALLSAANGIALLNLLLGAQYHNPIYVVPLRAVSDLIRREAQAGDVVLSDYDIAFHYYWQPQQPADTQFFFTEHFPQALNAIQHERAPRVWLISFGRDRSRVGDRTDEMQTWLAADYALREARGYAPVDSMYRAVKQRLIGREAYADKLIVRLFERRP